MSVSLSSRALAELDERLLRADLACRRDSQEVTSSLPLLRRAVHDSGVLPRIRPPSTKVLVFPTQPCGFPCECKSCGEELDLSGRVPL